MSRHRVAKVTIGNQVIQTGQEWTPRGNAHAEFIQKVIGFTPRSVVTEVIRWSRAKRNKIWTTPYEKFVKTNILVK